MKITFEEVEEWLGTSNPEEEAIDTLMSIANGDYKPEDLEKDIIATVR